MNTDDLHQMTRPQLVALADRIRDQKPLDRKKLDTVIDVFHQKCADLPKYFHISSQDNCNFGPVDIPLPPGADARTTTAYAAWSFYHSPGPDTS